MKKKKIIELIESFGERYYGRYSNDNFTLLGRRWDALKIIVSGVKEENYEDSLKLVEQLMKKNPQPDSKDGKLLGLLADQIVNFEQEERY